MGQRMTEKQLGFCQSVVEGMTASDAYRANYNAGKMKVATIHRRAMELMDNGKVTARIAVLRAEYAEKNAFTVERIARGLEQARVQAIEDHQNSAAVQAGMGLAKLFGMLEDKLSIKGEVSAETGISFLSQKYGVDVGRQIEASDEDTKH